MAITIIEPQTAAVTAKTEIRVTDVPATISATNLAGAEAIPFFFSVDNGRNWESWSLDGSAVELTVTNKSIGLYSPVLIAVTKPVTAGTTGVYLTTPNGEGKL